MGYKKRKIGGLIENFSTPLKDADIHDLNKYKWPLIDDDGRIRGLKERAEFLFKKTDYAIAARSVSHGFFELAWELRSMDGLMIDMHFNKQFVNKILDKTLKVQMQLYKLLLDNVGNFIQIVETADDYGTQNGLMISPEMFRSFIKPRRRELNFMLHDLAPNAKIFHHTCGSVYDIIEDLIEIGIDILNPIQPLAKNMNSEKLKSEFGKRLCFHGGIDLQQALRGSGENLELEIQRRINAFAGGGGYIIAPTSNFQDDIPIENIFLFIKASKKHGIYLKKKQN